MRHLLILLAVALFAVNSYGQDRCNLANQSATNAFQQTKKSLEAYNISLMKLSVKRAISIFDELKVDTQKCGCKDANNSSYDALDNLSKAMEKEEFEDSRFYVSRAHRNAQDIISYLEVCQQKGNTFTIDQEEDLASQRRQLLEQQKRLEEQQRQLEQEMKRQKLLQDEILEKKQQELEAQSMLKSDSEKALDEMETAIRQIIKSMGCENARPLVLESYKRTLEELEEETLEATKSYYAFKAKELAHNLINSLDACDQ